MNIKIVTKETFSVIGKLGQGLSSDRNNWIPKIWEEANTNFDKIFPFIKKDENGNIIGLWGLMSDVNEKLSRWEESGKYLAGCEVEDDVLPPEGFAKWTIPTQTYVVAKCSIVNYSEVFNNTINQYLPQHNMQIIGAVHEHYLQPENPNKIELYFPIKKGEEYYA